MPEVVVLECPECGEEKHMVREDLGYREENEVGIRCVHCNIRNPCNEWEETGSHG